jgi:hypothetical protein
MTLVRCNPFSIRKVNEAQWRDKERFTSNVVHCQDEGYSREGIQLYILDTVCFVWLLQKGHGK